MAVPGGVSGEHLCFISGSLPSCWPLKYLTFMTSRRVIQLISFSWGLTVGFILFESFVLFTFRAEVVFDALLCIVFVLFYIFPCVFIINFFVLHQCYLSFIFKTEDQPF